MTGEAEIRTVENEDFLIEAAQLVFDRYSAVGLMKAPKPGVPLIAHVFPAFTTTFVAIEGKRIVATLSLMRKTEKDPLPMEETFPEEVNALIGEVGIDGLREGGRMAFANGLRHPRRVVYQLFETLLAHCLSTGIQIICMAVNPRRGNFYERAPFDPMPGVRVYQKMGNAPAIGRSLDLRRGHTIEEILRPLVSAALVAA